ncbi:MAG: cell division protein, partial [Massilia sp.]|nr:cell division protein [Massilia sp.]
MTDLQMSLIGGAVVFVGAVFVYNKWQEHKARKSVERAFSSEHDDVLMRPGETPPVMARHEPSFDLGAGGGGDSGEPEPRLEPVVADTVIGDDATPAAEQATSLVDPLIDCLIPLALDAPARGDKILPALHKLRRVGNKPIHFIGLAVNGDWEPIVHGGVYTELQAGVQ